MKKETISDEQKQMKTKEAEMYVRKQKIWNLIIQGVPQDKIAEKLGVSLKTVSRDFKEIKKDSIEWMDTLHEGQLQLYYRSDFETVNRINAELWEKFHNTKDEKFQAMILSRIFRNVVIHNKMLVQSKLLEVGNEVHKKISPDTFDFMTPWKPPKPTDIDYKKIN